MHVNLRRVFLLTALFGTIASAAAENEALDPAKVSEADAINCHLDVPSYNGFAFAVVEQNGLAFQRHWRKIDTANPFFDEYELPNEVVVTGNYTTRRIAFTSTGILAVLDLADPNVIAREEGISNTADPKPLIEELVASGKATHAEIEANQKFVKFLGQQVLVDTTEPSRDGESFGIRTIITRNISNVITHPGKTLYGCSYRTELIGKDGKPL